MEEKEALILALYTAFVFTKFNSDNLLNPSTQNKASSLKIRSFCRKAIFIQRYNFFGIIPDTRNKSEWIKAIISTREQFEEDKKTYLNALISDSLSVCRIVI